MSRLQSDQYIRKLDSEFLQAKNLDEEYQEVYSRYLCIRISGLVEVALKEKLLSFVEDRRSHPVINEYIQNAVREITNLRASKISTILGNFSKEWKQKFDEGITESQKDALGNVYKLRNNIAHGRNDNISLRTLEDYYKEIKDAIEHIRICISK